MHGDMNYIYFFPIFFFIISFFKTSFFFINHLQLLKLVKDSLGELGGTGAATKILSLEGTSGNDIVGGLRDSVSVGIKTKVTKHHGGRKDHGSGVSLVSALNVKTDVSAAGLEKSVLTAKIDTGDKTGATNKGSTNVTKNGTVKVRGDENIKLLGSGNSLHGGIIDNHVGVSNTRVVLTNLSNGGTEKTISKLHNVGLVNSSDLLSVVLKGKVVGEAGNALRLVLGDNLEGLNNAGDGLVLETRVLTFSVFTDKDHVNAIDTGGDTWNVLDQDDRGVNVEFATESNVERSVTRLLNGGVKNTLKTDLVSLEGKDGLVNTLGGVTNTVNIDFLPVNGDILSLENSLDRVGDFSTNTVT